MSHCVSYLSAFPYDTIRRLIRSASRMLVRYRCCCWLSSANIMAHRGLMASPLRPVSMATIGLSPVPSLIVVPLMSAAEMTKEGECRGDRASSKRRGVYACLIISLAFYFGAVAMVIDHGAGSGAARQARRWRATIAPATDDCSAVFGHGGTLLTARKDAWHVVRPN